MPSDWDTIIRTSIFTLTKATGYALTGEFSGLKGFHQQRTKI
jgi:hypothetical protein